jgi:hypothetical protein
MEMADHDLAIHEVLGAAEGDETDFDHAGQGVRQAGMKNRGPGRGWFRRQERSQAYFFFATAGVRAFLRFR